MKRKSGKDRCCLNLDCPVHGQFGKDNIIRHSFYKTSQGRRRRYLCTSCRKTFLFQCRNTVLPTAEITGYLRRRESQRPADAPPQTPYISARSASFHAVSPSSPQSIRPSGIGLAPDCPCSRVSSVDSSPEVLPGNAKMWHQRGRITQTCRLSKQHGGRLRLRQRLSAFLCRLLRFSLSGRPVGYWILPAGPVDLRFDGVWFSAEGNRGQVVDLRARPLAPAGLIGSHA
jgi:hypothetical protein